MLLSINACSRDSGPTLAAPDAYAQAQAGKLTLIDIRRPEEWKQTGVAKDALQINMAQGEAGFVAQVTAELEGDKNALQINMAHPQGMAGFVQQVTAELGPDRNAPIGLICRTGNRTTQMQRVLTEAGFTQVYNVKEGMAGSAAGPGWIARGLPLEACERC
jgi:rhodanese-related sulfurtransferase